jgi:hypothetical protein
VVELEERGKKIEFLFEYVSFLCQASAQTATTALLEQLTLLAVRLAHTMI